MKYARSYYPSAFGNPATMPRMWAARHPTCLAHFECVEKMHSRTHTNEQENCERFLEICTTNQRQIRPSGTQLSQSSWFGGVLGPCGGVLEPSGPKGPPGCILGCENHVRGPLFGNVFWYCLRCFFFFVLLSSRHCIQNGILLCHFEHIFNYIW